MFIGLLSFSGSLARLLTCIFLNMPNSVNLNSDEYSQGLCCYPFMVNLDVIDDLSSEICAPCKTKYINFRVVIW